MPLGLDFGPGFTQPAATPAATPVQAPAPQQQPQLQSQAFGSTTPQPAAAPSNQAGEIAALRQEITQGFEAAQADRAAIRESVGSAATTPTATPTEGGKGGGGTPAQAGGKGGGSGTHGGINSVHEAELAADERAANAPDYSNLQIDFSNAGAGGLGK